MNELKTCSFVVETLYDEHQKWNSQRNTLLKQKSRTLKSDKDYIWHRKNTILVV